MFSEDEVINDRINRLRWRKKALSCSYCPPNKNENIGHGKNQFWRKHWSWKFRIKKKHQYEPGKAPRGYDLWQNM